MVHWAYGCHINLIRRVPHALVAAMTQSLSRRSRPGITMPQRRRKRTVFSEILQVCT